MPLPMHALAANFVSASGAARRLALLAGLAAGSLLLGCDNKQKDELAMLRDRNAQLEEELDQTRTALDGTDAQRRQLEADNMRLRTQAEEAQRSGATDPATSTAQLPTDLPAGMGARLEGNAVIIDISGDILFASGQATLKNESKKSLDQLARVLKEQYPGKRISVEGFTDTDPIKRSKWSDNWHLAFERARAVGKYLTSKGFSESQFRYVSYGETSPKPSKQASRRVELAIVDGE